MAPTPERISEIQSALAAQGAYKGEPNGKWDDATIQAMKDFQSAHGLSPTGKLDALSLQKLGLGSEIAGRGAPLSLPPTQAANRPPSSGKLPEAGYIARKAALVLLALQTTSAKAPREGPFASSEDFMATAVRPTVLKNFINGEWVESSSRLAFENRNPANTRELIGMFPRSTAEDVDAAVRAAADAFQSWRLVPAPKRAEILYRAAETLVKRKDDLARDMTREMGKVLAEARGDVQEAIDMTYYMAGEGRRLFGQTTPSELPSKFAMSARQPLGVCALITPWNFPMAIPSWKIMPALVCGNTVVIKPAEDTPLSTYTLVQILTEAGVPRGVVNVVNGIGPEVGAPLVEHPGVAAVSFTGSTEVGRLVSQECAPKLRPCHLEMGGKNILIVLEDANLDLAVDGAIWGGFGTTGQRCTAASRVAVDKKIYKEFLHRFVERAKALRVGDGLDPATEMGPCINEEQLGKVMEYVAIGNTEGAKLMTGGHRLTDGNTRTAGSTKPPSLPIAIPACASRRRRFSARLWR